VGEVIDTLLVGYGYWGRIMARNLVDHPAYFLAGVHDPDPRALADAKTENLHSFHSMRDALEATHPKLVVVCAPIGSIFMAASEALHSYANVMLAKPGVTTMDEYVRLFRVADYNQRKVVVDYTMLSHQSWQTLCTFKPQLGELVTFHALRYSVGNRTGAPLLFDMMVHDLAMLVEWEPGTDWLVDSAEVTECVVAAKLVSGRKTALVEARTDQFAPKRAVSLGGARGFALWDQIDDVIVSSDKELEHVFDEDDAPKSAVYRRLSDTALVVNKGAPDNRVTFRRVTELANQIVEAAR
jgi:predicted dehydrogenase